MVTVSCLSSVSIERAMLSLEYCSLGISLRAFAAGLLLADADRVALWKIFVVYLVQLIYF
jgi:hypothetical protein